MRYAKGNIGTNETTPLYHYMGQDNQVKKVNLNDGFKAFNCAKDVN